MTTENVEVVKRGVDAYNRGDVEALLEVLDPEVEWHPGVLIAFEGRARVYRGHEGVREMMGDVFDAWKEVTTELSEFRDLGDRIVAIGRLRIRGRGSGADLESPFGSVTEISNGKAIRVLTFFDHKEALAAAGLSE
jgi:ketosteroid isomerase-like protein